MKKNFDMSKPLVLIADDDESARLLLRATITQWDYPTIEARDGQEALDILKGPNAPEMATIDWMMPKMDGLELCGHLKKLPNRPYVILLTGINEASSSIKALDAGADDFLSKPINHAELRTRLSLGLRVIHYERYLRLLLNDSGAIYERDIGTLKKNIDEITRLAEHLTMYTNSIHCAFSDSEQDVEFINSSLKEIAIKQAYLNQKLKGLKEALIEQDRVA